MRATLCILALVITVSPASANPVWNDGVIVEFADGQNCVWPSYPNQVITARVVLTEPILAQAGIVGFAFRIERTFGGWVLDTRNLLDPGGLMAGSVEGDGLSLASATCVLPDEQGRIPIAEIDYVYLGPPGLLTVTGSLLDGQTFVDCEVAWQSWYTYEDLNTGGVGEVPPAGCFNSPVETLSWGSIKAMYH